jgi:hypothetical protein
MSFKLTTANFEPVATSRDLSTLDREECIAGFKEYL